MDNLNDEQKDFLKTYLYVKNNPNLATLADELESKSLNEIQSDEKFDKLSSNILQTIKDGDNANTTINTNNSTNKKVTRVFMDGVFDIIHSGHFNALRQGRKLGDYLVLGVNSDEDVEKAKGPPLMSVEERAILVGACKWVDEVVIGTPYTPSLEILDNLNIDFCVHGDDPCFNENGEDVYGPMKKAGRFKMFKRTEGISTTDIIGRLLMLTSSRKKSFETDTIFTTSSILSSDGTSTSTTSEIVKNSNQANEENLKGPVISSFLTTGRRLHEFCNNKVPKDTDKVVYVDGAWDILHGGHIEVLKKAKEMGDFLYVGVHDDMTINKNRGKNYPILNLQERVFNLLALKYVDDVVLAAPWKITEDLIKSLKISVVARGANKPKYETEIQSEEEDPYDIPRKQGILKEIQHNFILDNDELLNRLLKKRDHYVKKYEKKSKSEKGYYANKEYCQEI